MKLFEQIDFVRWIKLCVAVPVAMILAEAMGLSFSFSAGIITLLTVFGTRKETLAVAAKRILAFGIMLLLCKIIFEIAGCSIATYAVFLCVFIYVCYLLNMEIAISMNAVLATHFLSVGDVSAKMLLNESLLFIVGTGLGVLVNLIMPGNIQRVREKQKETDEKIRTILTRMSEHICKEDKTDYTGSCFAQLEDVLAGLKKEAFIRMQNTMAKEDAYFLKYMQMRNQQCEILKNIYASIKDMTYVPNEAQGISLLLKEIADSFHEMNNAVELSEHLENLWQAYKQGELPKDRDEFENRAALLQILRNLKLFLQKKQEFVKLLTEEEKQKYWNREVKR